LSAEFLTDLSFSSATGYGRRGALTVASL
jgi:hypothetical protein